MVECVTPKASTHVIHIFLSYLIPDYAKAIMSSPDIANTVSVNVGKQELRSKSVKVHSKTSFTEHPGITFKSKKRLKA